MRVALFVPCYVDQLYPDVGFAALELLERHGASVEVLSEPGCCGQPFSNLGAVEQALPLARQFQAALGRYDYVVCPSGSCTATLHRHAAWLGASGTGHEPTQAGRRVLELCEFLVQVLGVAAVDVTFPHRVALHEGCHGLRELGLGQPSELGAGARNYAHPARQLLGSVKGLTLIEPSRPDECCGFGGSFAVKEAAVSKAMGCDRIEDFARAGAEVVTSGDMSCLMHLEGLMRRDGRALGVMHLAQILAGRTAPEPIGA